MSRTRATAIAVCAGALLATAAGARAQTIQTAHAPIDLNSDAFSSFSAAPEPNHLGPQAAQKSLFWDQKGHWGLKLDLSQPVGRDMELRDIQAGAYFHITPSIRVGGAVALGDAGAFDRTNPLPQQNQQGSRVKLETSFKF